MTIIVPITNNNKDNENNTDSKSNNSNTSQTFSNDISGKSYD